MTVGELLSRIDSRELLEWSAYERVHGPIGPDRADTQAAVIASTIARTMGGKKARRFKLSDFIPVWDRRPQTWEEQLAAVRTMNRALGGRDLTRPTTAQEASHGNERRPGEPPRPHRRR